MSNEADTLSHNTCSPSLQAAGWADEQIRELLIFTAGRIVVADYQAHPKLPVEGGGFPLLLTRRQALRMIPLIHQLRLSRSRQETSRPSRNVNIDLPG